MSVFTKTSCLLALLIAMCFQSLQAQEYAYTDAWGSEGLTLSTNSQAIVELNFSLPSFKLEDFDLKGEAMKNIVMSGAFVPNDEGAPNMPAISKFIAVPQGAVPVVKITGSRVETLQGLSIAPAPRIPLDNDESPLVYNKNPEIYGKNAFYPNKPVRMSEMMKIRGVDVVQIGVSPFLYNPVTGDVQVYRDIKIEVEFVGGNGHFGEDRLRSRWWDPIVEDAILNHSSLPTIDYDARIQANMNSEETGAEYLIIRPTGAVYAQWADSIKNWRVRQGITTMIKTVTEVGGNTTTAIENYINNAYNTWTIPPAACLLLGDYGTDAATNIISPIYNSYCASDNIFGDVNGDHLPDVVMARITANNATELETMISKGLKYERNPPVSPYYYSHPITALGWQTERWFQICSETVGGYFANVHGKTPVRINEIYSGTPGSVWSTATNTSTVVDYFGPNGLGYIPASPSTLGGWSGGNATMINNAMNAGAFILQHRDHGMETGWGEPSYTNSNINGLTNTDLTFIFSINCLTGKYNWSSECFTEKFHRYKYNNMNAGALALIGASEVSYSFVNDTYVWGMYDNMWPDFMPAYGTTPGSRGIVPSFGNAAGKYFLQQSSWPYNTSNKEVTYHLFHHHGDAFLTLFSEVPQTLTVSHAPVLYAGTTSFEVTANVGSMICLTVDNVIIGTGTGTGAPVSITIPSQVPPSMVVVTVTKQNYRRYTGMVSVVPASGPYVVYTGSTISDPLPNGNNNGLMDYAETNKLNVTLKNVGVQQATAVTATLSSTSPYVTITDNTEPFGAIDPNATVTKTDAFTYTVANNVPDQTIVNFSLVAASGASNWNSSFSILAQAPVLSIGNMTILDNGAGCNNNGILDPGETASVVIANSNTGHSSISNLIGTLSVQGASTFLTINTTTCAVATMAAGASADATFSVTASATAPIGTPVNLLYSLSGGASAQYTSSSTKQLVIGLIPTYNMSNTSQTTCVGNFYDSGGSTGSYQNNENYTMTFTPGTSGAKIKATFLSFATESGYDYLYIYDGPTTASTQVAGSPFHGSTSPGTITASAGNATGALTFKFTSDVSQTYTGWSATIQCQGGGPIPTVNFTANNTTICTGSSVTFTDNSSNSPTSWAWTFPGGTPSSSTLQSPTVTYATAGNYDVTLVSTNSYGSGSLTKPAYITVNGSPASPGTPSGNSSLCLNPTNTDYVTAGATSATSYVWELTPAGAGSISGTGTTATVDWNNTYTGSASVRVKGINACGEGTYSSPLDVTISTTPVQPATPTGPAQVCQAGPDTEYGVVNVVGATAYVWQLLPVNAGTIAGTWTYGTVTWDPGFVGQASISVKAVNQCGESAYSPILSVDVDAAPTAFNVTGGGEICEGSAGTSVGLSGSQTGVNYTLMLNGTSTGNTVTGTGSAISFGNQQLAGTYTVDASNAQNCISTMNGNAAISVMPLPATPGTPTGPNYVNTSVAATADYTTTGSTNAATYAWSLDPTTAGTVEGIGITATVTWSASYLGNATVFVKGVNQCGESTVSEGFIVEVDNNVGINNLSNLNFAIYPNPTDGKVKILPQIGISGKGNITILNSLAETVLETTLTFEHNQASQLDLSQLAKGVYVLKIATDKAEYKTKLIIQ